MNIHPDISIIIPIYNTEKYLSACLDSVLAQSLQNLDIILIDDGSTDESGKICDQYAKKDDRIRVFHNKHAGLMNSRKFGVDIALKAGPNYISFVDGDDWIEPEMFKTLYDKAVETSADIVECGFYYQFPEKTLIWLPTEDILGTNEALCEFFRSGKDYLWNKLWKVSLFEKFTIPEGNYYSDMLISYRVFMLSEKKAGVRIPFYHYRQNSESIVHQHDMRLLSFWLNIRQKYMFIHDNLQQKINPDVYKDIENIQLRKCVYAIGKNWAWWNGSSKDEQVKNFNEIIAMSEFMREYTPLFGRRGWSIRERFTCLMTRFPNRFTLRLAWIIIHIDRKTRETKLF